MALNPAFIFNMGSPSSLSSSGFSSVQCCPTSCNVQVERWDLQLWLEAAAVPCRVALVPWSLAAASALPSVWGDTQVSVPVLHCPHSAPCSNVSRAAYAGRLTDVL